MRKKLLISLSGGRTSAFMCHQLLQTLPQSEWDIKIVFANTGQEREETLFFVQMCAEHYGWPVVWVESVTDPKHGVGVSARVVDYSTASRSGEPFNRVIAKYGIPNQSTPHCSRELKGHAIRAYARSIGWKTSSYITAIGIRRDEPRRLDWKKAKAENLWYPLAEWGVSKFDVSAFWASQPFDLELKSYEGNCVLCWKKSLRKLMTIVRENPSAAEWVRHMEKQFGEYVPLSRSHNPNIKLPRRFFRGNRTIDDIIQESNDPDFVPAVDDSREVAGATYAWIEEIDSNGGCVESCEAF